MHKTLASLLLLFSVSFCQTESFLSYISRDILWKHSKEDSLMAIAVDKACVSAKERAELYANRFGVKIIKITKILPDYYETAGENFGANYDASKVIYQGTSITIQNVVINSRVTIIYKFK